MQIFSFSPFGYEGALVTVEVDLRRGIPAVDLVGLADNAVKEARERMQAAIRNSGFDFPPERVLISLSPADLKKEGAGFDLPIALGVLYESLAAKDGTEQPFSEPVLIMGELELSGRIRPVRGVHAAASTAAAGGILKCIVPVQNAEEAREVSGMAVFGAENLTEAFNALKNPEVFTKKISHEEAEECLDGFEETDGVYFSKIRAEYEFAFIKGQKKLIRALQIAAAGGHNLIAVGAPGCGKTMAIQKLPALLPALTKEKAQPLTRVYSIAGLLPPGKSLIRTAPFRVPHQTASLEGMCGGGAQCRPGEISLAHNGVLFLDEAAEFRTSVLQMLRVPIETGSITITRAGRTTVYPAEFQLVMASNPCPCGNYGSESKICLCSARSVELYWKKFSAPLLDRMDLRVSVANEADDKKPVSTAELRTDIARAVLAERRRQGKKNARLSADEIALHCAIADEDREFLARNAARNNFSPRATASILKVARTIADLDGKRSIESAHIKEAVELRKPFNDFMTSGN